MHSDAASGGCRKRALLPRHDAGRHREGQAAIQEQPGGLRETVAEVWPGDNDCDIYDAHRFVHAVNLLPELVEALEAAWYAMEKHARSECSREIATALAVLKKANNININERTK